MTRGTSHRHNSEDPSSENKNLPCEFVLAEDENLSANLRNDLALVLRSAVLQNVLNDVVTVLILQRAVEAELMVNRFKHSLVAKRARRNPSL